MDRVCGLSPAAVAAASSSTGLARAQDRKSWIEGQTMPGTKLSCCSIADCRQTKADQRSGRWWAKVRGQRTPIRHASEPNKPSFDGNASVCSNPARHIDCFVKPGMMM